ncbi:hypothetical protein OIU85_030333 [Salix viminalis]|uniref:Uncharacterized protein n=1 Tax=Salix viminalis TaxID=40686 RepID=A0A9Q0T7S4_SALVM|nr:hypothetical protein OIU85_030333 [Salix viminalis]
MVVQHQDRYGKAKNKLHNLAISDQSFPLWPHAHCTPKGVDKFKNFGEVEYVGPEKERPGWRGVGREANDVAEVRAGGGGDDGEGAAKGHDEGERRKRVKLWRAVIGFEDVGSSKGRRERDSGEKECEEEVGGNCEGEELVGGAEGLALGSRKSARSLGGSLASTGG